MDIITNFNDEIESVTEYTEITQQDILILLIEFPNLISNKFVIDNLKNLVVQFNSTELRAITYTGTR